MIEDDVPHIQVECAHCHFLFDLTRGDDCPRCKLSGIVWARQITDEEYARERNALFGDYAERLLRKKMDEFVERHRAVLHSLTVGDELDIAELDRMYALQEDK